MTREQEKALFSIHNARVACTTYKFSSTLICTHWARIRARAHTAKKLAADEHAQASSVLLDDARPTEPVHLNFGLSQLY